jgi:predicted HicB family RNase H-like nuclease
MIYLDKSWRVPEKMRACPDCKAALESGLSLESLVGHKKNQVQNRVEDFRKEETKHIQRKTKRNMKKIVQFLSFGGVYSQREISRETGVCRVSVSKCMVLLESLGQARRVEPPPHEHRSYLWEAVREE